MWDNCIYMFHKSSLKTWAFFICIAKIIKIATQNTKIKFVSQKQGKITH